MILLVGYGCAMRQHAKKGAARTPTYRSIADPSSDINDI